MVVNPLVSIVIGATAFSERLRAGPLSVTVDVLAILLLCVGIAVLARSPLVAGVGGVGGQTSDEYPAARAVPTPAPTPAPTRLRYHRTSADPQDQL